MSDCFCAADATETAREVPGDALEATNHIAVPLVLLDCFQEVARPAWHLRDALGAGRVLARGLADRCLRIEIPRNSSKDYMWSGQRKLT